MLLAFCPCLKKFGTLSWRKHVNLENHFESRNPLTCTCSKLVAQKVLNLLDHQNKQETNIFRDQQLQHIQKQKKIVKVALLLTDDAGQQLQTHWITSVSFVTKQNDSVIQKKSQHFHKCQGCSAHPCCMKIQFCVS